VNGSTITGETILGGGGNILTHLHTTSSATLTLVYTYTPHRGTIPEIDASSVGSVAALLIGSVCTLRGRRRSTPAHNVA
jgi:hypothetical protein